MTEAEWLTSTDPQEMVHFLRDKASECKMQMFAAACCRRIWHLLTDERSRQVVEVAERYADGQATEEELETASAAAWAVCHEESEEPVDYIPDSASLAAYNVAIPFGWWGGAPKFVAPHEIAREVSANSRTEEGAQCVLLREIFGNPFHSVRIDPLWLTWNDGIVLTLAQAIYDQRAFDRLPILADALEEAGCTDADTLAHCREQGEHVRGCWVLDLLLGKS